MKKKIIFLFVLSCFIIASGFAMEPIITWNKLKIPLSEGIFYEKISKNEMHIFIKNVKNSLLSISYGDIANKDDISKRIGYKINNCAFEYLRDAKFCGIIAFEWQVTCSANGTKTTLTIPELNCEISLEGKRNEFDNFEDVINAIKISE